MKPCYENGCYKTAGSRPIRGGRPCAHTRIVVQYVLHTVGGNPDRPEGSCILWARCGGQAEIEGLCAAHDLELRRRCEVCGHALRGDKLLTRGVCPRCWPKTEAGRRERERMRDLVAYHTALRRGETSARSTEEYLATRRRSPVGSRRLRLKRSAGMVTAGKA